MVVVSKLGVHSNGSHRNGFGPFLQTIQAAGRQLALTDCHDDYGAGFDAAEYFPEMLNIGDLTVFEADFNIDVLRDIAALNPHINYWQIYNEINGDWVGQADRQIQYMQAYGNEFKFVLFNCANGTPPYPYEDNEVAYSNVARACKVAKAGGHLLGLHEYGYDWGGDTLLRYRKLVDYLRAHDALCDIVITEAGPDEGTFIGIEPFMEWCKRYDAELMKDAPVKGAALWTLGGGGWGAVNFQTALPALGEYIATVPAEIIPEPTMTKLTGVHSRESGGDLDNTDIARIAGAGGKLSSFKFTTQDARGNHAKVAGQGIPIQNCLVRLFWDSSGFGSIPAPADFYGWFSLSIKEAIQDGITWIEFLNEPNLIQEWKWTPAEFVTFAKSVIAMIKANNPTAKIITPGLSPNDSVPTWDNAFASGGLYAVCDGIGAHSYGTQPSHLNDDNQLRYYRRFAPRLTGTQKIWITEASLKNYSIAPYDVGKLYGEYANTLEDYVQGVWFFILQGDAFESSGESWNSRADIPRGLADYTPVTDREFDHWEDTDTGASLGTANPLMFSVTGNRHIKAVTRPKLPEPVVYTVSTMTDGYGVVTGGGTYTSGSIVTLTWSLT